MILSTSQTHCLQVPPLDLENVSRSIFLAQFCLADGAKLDHGSTVEGLNHVQFLTRLVKLELIDREGRENVISLGPSGPAVCLRRWSACDG